MVGVAEAIVEDCAEAMVGGCSDNGKGVAEAIVVTRAEAMVGGPGSNVEGVDDVVGGLIGF